MTTILQSNYIKVLGLLILLIALSPIKLSAQVELREVTVVNNILLNKDLIDYLKLRIIPLAKANNFNIDKDEIIISYRQAKNPYTLQNEKHISIIITSDCDGIRRSRLLKMENDKKYSETKIDGITIVLENISSSDSLSVVHGHNTYKYKINTNSILQHGICDNSASWHFKMTSNSFRLLNFQNWGLTWFNKQGMDIYLPPKPLKILDSTKRLKPTISINHITKNQLPLFISNNEFR